MTNETKIANELRRMGFKNGDVVYFDGDTLSFNRPKVDPEAWREKNSKRQAAGAKFQIKHPDAGWFSYESFGDFATGKKEDYREVQEAPKPTIPHVKERALYRAQQAAGTNEVWRGKPCKSSEWLVFIGEPGWYSDWEYEVKPKTVRYYFALAKRHDNKIIARLNIDKDQLVSVLKTCGYTIIGNIEEREVEV